MCHFVRRYFCYRRSDEHRRGRGVRSDGKATRFQSFIAARMALAAGLLTCAIVSVSAQSAPPAPLERSVKAQSGRDVRVGVFASMKADCTPGQLPTVRLKEMPKNGTVTVKQGRLRATNLKHCLAAEVPAFVAIYRSRPDFTGSDELTLEVVNANGKTQLQRIQVTVEKPQVGQSL
jgi:hypothetical protein